MKIRPILTIENLPGTTERCWLLYSQQSPMRLYIRYLRDSLGPVGTHLYKVWFTRDEIALVLSHDEKFSELVGGKFSYIREDELDFSQQESLRQLVSVWEGLWVLLDFEDPSKT